VKSANDVAVALAEAIAPSHEAFVERMNATAARLGMTHTKFVNANGLPATDQVTTARDMAKLASAVVRDYPQYAHFWSMLEAQVGKHRLHTHNGILTNYAGADGMKTGFICNSGFNVVASATRDGHKLIAVVLGEATGAERTVRTANLLEHGFQVHEWKSMFSSHTVESLPTAENIKTTVTIPQKVISWVCGTGRAIPKTKKDQAATGRQRDQKPVLCPNGLRSPRRIRALGPRGDVTRMLKQFRKSTARSRGFSVLVSVHLLFAIYRYLLLSFIPSFEGHRADLDPWPSSNC